jgi:uncharacterized protein YjbI with pentapeptide repeats
MIEIKHKVTGKVLLCVDEWLKDVKRLDGNSAWFPLAGVDLSGADLRGIDLSGADLQNAGLEGAIYDDDTRWPDGFDPDRHGARLRE